MNQAKASAQNTTPKEDSSAAQDEANSDIALCSGAMSTAMSCCGNPWACMSSADQRAYQQQQQAQNDAGMTGSCEQMQQLGASAASMNAKLAGICAGDQNSCQQTCESLLQKYQSLSASCNGCASQSVYDGAVNQLSSSQQSCNSLTPRLQALSSQSLEGGVTNGYGNTCMQTASAGDLGAVGSGGDSSQVATAANCAANPNIIGCSVLAAYAASPASTAGFQSAPHPATMAQNNVSPIPATYGTAMFQAPNDNGNSQALTAPIIANNSGGQMPELPANGGARLDPKTGRLIASRGVSTDVLGGVMRVSGYSQASGSGFDTGDSSRATYGRNSRRGLAASGGPSVVGLDLKQFLPGGRRDPRSMGGLSGKNSQINGRGEDIFQLISNKMVEKCRLGVLWSCT